jgi:hypothetical protein
MRIAIMEGDKHASPGYEFPSQSPQRFEESFEPDDAL